LDWGTDKPTGFSIIIPPISSFTPTPPIYPPGGADGGVGEQRLQLSSGVEEVVHHPQVLLRLLGLGFVFVCWEV
jgi:hypothetical protein